jgi:hypothetical protein
MRVGIIQFTFILTIIFVIAKLINVIAWSWWLIFLPAIIGAGISVLIIFLLLVIMVMAEQMEREG